MVNLLFHENFCEPVNHKTDYLKLNIYCDLTENSGINFYYETRLDQEPGYLYLMINFFLI